jgi:hypothetical protein
MTKNNNPFFASLLSLTLLLLSVSLFGQKPNSYKFIEPNISIGYDSNRFKITNRYSNTTYETEAYDFEFKLDTVNKVNINIQANHPIDFLPRKKLDSLMLLGLVDIKAMENDSFAIANYDKQVRNINGFACLGFVGYDKANKKYATIISCYHLSTNDNTEIKFLSTNKNDLDADYELLKNFLTDFKSYSKAEIAKEDKIIKSKYTIIVSPAKTVIDNFQFRPKTFVGIVRTKQKLNYLVKEVRLANDFGQEIFPPSSDRSVPIVCNDKTKGKTIKKGELVLLNSFGKKVEVPFTFSYVNSGAR